MKAAGWIGAALAALALVACGGGGSSSSSTAAPAPTSAVAVNGSGTVTAFSSGIVVNGTGYATSASTSVVDGDSDDAPSAMADVQVGMTVDVAATTSSTPMVSFLRFTSQVRGEVDAVDMGDNQLTVLGQTVVLSSGTSFLTATGTAPTGASGFTAGNYVVVYGYQVQCTAATSGCPASGSQIIATLVVEPAKATIYRVQGFVTAAGTTAGTFSIGGLTVDTTTTGSSPTLCDPTCAPAAGTFVEVRSNTAPTATSSALTLNALLVRTKTQAPAFTAGSSVTLEGPLSQLAAGAATHTFVVRGVEIDAGASLASTVATLANDEVVDVVGTVNADGSIAATSITVVQHATLAVMGPLTADSTTSLTVLGQVFTVTSSTRFLDWATGVRPFNSTNFSTVLASGDQLIVSAYPSSGGLVATRVERIPTPATPVVAVEGVVASDSSSADTLTITGLANLSVAIESTTLLFYPGEHAAPTEAGFFSSIVPNASVAIVFGTAATSGSGSTATTTITAASAAALTATCGWAHY